MSRKTPAEPNALVELKALAANPAKQVDYAIEILTKEKDARVVQAAAAVLVENPNWRARPLLTRWYEHFEANGGKRDVGGYSRAALLKALRPVALPEDVPLLERAVCTYEFAQPGHVEVAALLRGAALVVLDDLDDDLASYHCVRLLADKHNSRMSGEPALTAIRLLAGRRRYLPLYYYVMNEREAISELRAEALRGLAGMPQSLLPSMVENFRHSEDEVLLVGLYDLILSQQASGYAEDVILEFLRTTKKYDVYRYVVTSIVAGRKKEWLLHLLAVAEDEVDRRKLEELTEALTFVRGEPALNALARQLRSKLGG